VAAADHLDVGADASSDTVCRIVRCTVGRLQLDALAAAGRPGGRGDALAQALLTSAWARAMPGEPAARWVRAVQPIEPPLEGIVPDQPVLVLVAGLRRVVAEEAGRGDAGAAGRLQAAREGFGGADRAEILGVLAQAIGRQAQPGAD